MSAHPIPIKTIYGSDQFNILYKQYEKYRGNPVTLQLFKERCLDDYMRINMYLRYFLENEDMMLKYRLDEDDNQSWNIFRQMSDMASCVKYFGEKQ